MRPVDDVSNHVQQRLTAGDRILVVVAGPNGAGKSTFVDNFLKPTRLRFINPDQIAQALAPDDPSAVAYEAAQAADSIRRDLVVRGVSFAMETVFSDPQGAKLGLLRHAQSQGYVVLLVFIGLESEDLAVARVIERVEAGGHDVPNEKIRSRFARTLANLTQALEFVDHAFLFDNSSADVPFRFVAELAKGTLVRRGAHRPKWATPILQALSKKRR
jgi:predicted ABC-type ATPase